MTRRHRVLLVTGIVLGMCAAALTMVNRAWSGRRTSSQLRAEVAALQTERNTLKAKRDELAARDSQFQDLPQTPVKVGIPTGLARDLIAKVLTGFADQASIELRNLAVSKTGTITKVVTLGEYRLRVNADRVSARLKPGLPRVAFGVGGPPPPPARVGDVRIRPRDGQAHVGWPQRRGGTLWRLGHREERHGNSHPRHLQPGGPAVIAGHSHADRAHPEDSTVEDPRPLQAIG